MTERDELKPCPFCGGDDIVRLDSPDTADDWVASFCLKCYASGPRRYTDDSAIRSWNRRAEG